jgi:hypothetical protein
MDSTQLHLGACLPHKQQIAGLLPLDILVQKAYFPRWAGRGCVTGVAGPVGRVLVLGGH